MGFQRNALLTLISALLAVIVAITGLTIWLFVQNTEKAENSQYDLMKTIVRFNLQGIENRALARAELVASLPHIRELFAARNRDALAAELKEMFEIQREKFGIDQAQFHLPPATSFLRLNSPSRFGDDLSSFRPIVVAVNADNVARKGLSISRSGPGIFGVTPVLDPAGKPIGSFEFGGNFGVILDGIKTAYGLESALFIDEQRLKNAAPDLGGDVYSEGNRMGRFVKYQSTNWELLRNLVSANELSDPNIENEPYTNEVQDTPYGVVVLQLRNPVGDLVGLIVVARDFSVYRSDLGKSIISLVMIAVFAFTFLTGVVVIILRGAIARPLAALNQRYQTLADGAEAEPIGDTHGFYGEIETLAQNYERLRLRQTAQSGPAGTP